MCSLTCKRCNGQTNLKQMPISERPRLLQMVREQAFVEAMKWLQSLGFSGLDSKFTFLHVTKRPRTCHRCGRRLPPGVGVTCGFCGALNLDFGDESANSAPHVHVRYAQNLIEPHACLRCAEPLGRGTTRCWTKDCGYVLPDHVVIRSE